MNAVLDAVTRWRRAVAPTLDVCRTCGETAAMEPAFHGRCSWCHYRATHPEWVAPWEDDHGA